MMMTPNRIESKSIYQPLRERRLNSRRRRNAVWRLSFCLAAALCLGLALQSSGLALLIVDPQDPIFGPAFHEPFDPSNAPQGATSFTITRAGVEFTFSTTNPNGLFFCSGNNCQLRAPRVEAFTSTSAQGFLLSVSNTDGLSARDARCSTGR